MKVKALNIPDDEDECSDIPDNEDESSE